MTPWFTYGFVENFLFFSLNVDILDLPFGKTNENMQCSGVRMLTDVMACWLMVLFVDAMVNRLTEIGLQI
jgi:hypothetical protein